MKRTLTVLVLVLGSILLTGHASPTVSVETIGVRTVEHIGSTTIVTEPGTLVLYH